MDTHLQGAWLTAAWHWLWQLALTNSVHIILSHCLLLRSSHNIKNTRRVFKTRLYLLGPRSLLSIADPDPESEDSPPAAAASTCFDVSLPTIWLLRVCNLPKWAACLHAATLSHQADTEETSAAVRTCVVKFKEALPNVPEEVLPTSEAIERAFRASNAACFKKAICVLRENESLQAHVLGNMQLHWDDIIELFKGHAMSKLSIPPNMPVAAWFSQFINVDDDKTKRIIAVGKLHLHMSPLLGDLAWKDVKRAVRLVPLEELITAHTNSATARRFLKRMIDEGAREDCDTNIAKHMLIAKIRDVFKEELLNEELALENILPAFQDLSPTDIRQNLEGDMDINLFLQVLIRKTRCIGEARALTKRFDVEECPGPWYIMPLHQSASKGPVKRAAKQYLANPATGGAIWNLLSPRLSDSLYGLLKLAAAFLISTFEPSERRSLAYGAIDAADRRVFSNHDVEILCGDAARHRVARYRVMVTLQYATSKRFIGTMSFNGKRDVRDNTVQRLLQLVHISSGISFASTEAFARTKALRVDINDYGQALHALTTVSKLAHGGEDSVVTIRRSALQTHCKAIQAMFAPRDAATIASAALERSRERSTSPQPQHPRTRSRSRSRERTVAHGGIASSSDTLSAVAERDSGEESESSEDVFQPDPKRRRPGTGS